MLYMLLDLAKNCFRKLASPSPPIKQHLILILQIFSDLSVNASLLVSRVFVHSFYTSPVGTGCLHIKIAILQTPTLTESTDQASLPLAGAGDDVGWKRCTGQR